jgi:hypothetical protein
MKGSRTAVELTNEEIAILLRWAERATRGVYTTCERYLGEAEAHLLAKLEELHRRATSDAEAE